MLQTVLATLPGLCGNILFGKSMQSIPPILLAAVFLPISCLAVNYEATCGISQKPPRGWEPKLKRFRDSSTAEGNYILGGITTTTRQFPWMVSLRLRRDRNLVSSHICGGSIVSSRAVVTAAHCVEKVSEEFPFVVLFYDKSGRMYIKTVRRIVKHPLYNPVTIDYDIAIIETDEKFAFDGIESFLRPICLPEKGDEIEDWHSCTIAGWGRVRHEDKVAPSALLMSDVTIIDENLCQKSYSLLNTITRRMFCAGDYEHGQKGACKGDSGGPLMCIRRDRKRYQMMGVISWGFRCGKPMFPSVFTDVAKLKRFIKETTGLD